MLLLLILVLALALILVGRSQARRDARRSALSEAQFAADPSEGNLAALNHIRDELASHTGFEAQIEGFGEASGRPANVVS